MRKPQLTPIYIGESLLAMIALVLVWRGMWRILDEIDLIFFGGSDFFFAVVSTAIGIAILLVIRKL